MITVHLPTQLAIRTGGARSLKVEGTTAADVLRRLESEHPGLRGWVLDERGRLREHVSLFLNDESAGLDRGVAPGDELYVIQAISGGAEGGGRPTELLLGTRKGLILLRGTGSGRMGVAHRAFAGQTVEYAIRDPRTDTYYASVTHGQFGPHLFYTDNPFGEWEEAEGPAFPAGTDAAVDRIWIVEPGEEDGVLWAGVAPAALFRSDDAGRTWRLNQALWEDATRPKWEGGMGGLCLHSICPWPGDSQRLALGISAAGVWLTEDGGASWQHCVEGLVARYLPEEARAETIMHCVHKLRRSPAEPDTLYMQFHGGVYRSDDAGRTWNEIGANAELPCDFGFPLAIDPRDPDRAFVIPLVADIDRVTPGGKLRVYETRDRGASWAPLTSGLPSEDAYFTVLRQAFCDDGKDPLGLFFGTESGAVFGSINAGGTWNLLAEHLPPILSVHCAA